MQAQRRPWEAISNDIAFSFHTVEFGSKFLNQQMPVCDMFCVKADASQILVIHVNADLVTQKNVLELFQCLHCSEQFLSAAVQRVRVSFSFPLWKAMG